MAHSKILILLILVSSFSHTCKRSQPEPTPPALTPVPVQDEPPPCASTFKETLADTLYTSDQAAFAWFPKHDTYFAQKIPLPKGAWGLIANPGFFIATFQCDTSRTWRETTCQPLPYSGTNFVSRRKDLNFDGFTDLWIDASDGGAHGNHFSLIFTYDTVQQTFKRDTVFELENLEIDYKKQRFRSRHFSSICGANIKSIYAYQGDSLALLGSALIQGCLNDSSKVEWQDYSGGTMTSNSLKTTPEKAWKIFSDLLWKTK